MTEPQSVPTSRLPNAPGYSRAEKPDGSRALVTVERVRVVRYGAGVKDPMTSPLPPSSNARARSNAALTVGQQVLAPRRCTDETRPLHHSRWLIARATQWHGPSHCCAERSASARARAAQLREALDKSGERYGRESLSPDSLGEAKGPFGLAGASVILYINKSLYMIRAVVDKFRPTDLGLRRASAEWSCDEG